MFKFEEAVAVLTNAIIDGDYEMMLDYCEEHHAADVNRFVNFPLIRKMLCEGELEVSMEASEDGLRRQSVCICVVEKPFYTHWEPKIKPTFRICIMECASGNVVLNAW